MVVMKDGAILGKRAGIGEYVSQLINHLSKIDRTNIYWLYTNEPLDLVLPDNFTERKIEAPRYLWHLKTALDIKANNLDVLRITKVKEDKISVINLGIEHTFNRATKTELARVEKKYNLPKDYIL